MKTAWYAYPSTEDRNPHGHVEQVTVLHEEGDGTAIVKMGYGYVTTVAGPFSGGKLFDTEADAWDYCAITLAKTAARMAEAAAECRAKSSLEVVS
jgi:hypothetical protein